MSRGPSQLLFTRIVCVLLAIAATTFAVAALRLQQRLEFLAAHANWLYPYVPNLGEGDFKFTVGYFGMEYSGTYRQDWEVLFAGGTEKPDLFFCKDIAKSLGNPKSVYVDVGANKGLHALFLSKQFGTVVAYEPIPSIVADFQANIDRNEIHNIVVRPVGLGNEEAVVPFFQDENPFTGSFREDFNSTVKTRSEFEVKRGDEDLKVLGFRPDLIKVDVEGYEAPVLEGLAKTLEEARPVVLMELLPETIATKAYGFTGEPALKALFPEDYLFFEFAEYEVYTGGYTLKRLDYEARKHLSPPSMFVFPRNIVAIPKEKLGLIPAGKME